MGSNFWANLRAPRTILGFVVAIVAVVGYLTYKVAGLLVRNSSAQYLMPWVLGCGLGIIFLAIAFVAVLVVVAPEKLMLGEVQGDVFLKIMKLRQGDSQHGDVTERVAPIDGKAKLIGSTSGAVTEDASRA